jgi:hypothetical protein
VRNGRRESEDELWTCALGGLGVDAMMSRWMDGGVDDKDLQEAEGGGARTPWARAEERWGGNVTWVFWLSDKGVAADVSLGCGS